MNGAKSNPLSCILYLTFDTVTNRPDIMARFISGHLVRVNGDDGYCGLCAEEARENGGNPDAVPQPCEHQVAVMAVAA